MKKIVSIGDQQHELEIERSGTTSSADGLTIEVIGTDGGTAEIRVAGRTHFVPFIVQGTTVSFTFDGEVYTAEVTDRSARPKARHGAASMAAPMPGAVLKILTAPGSVVTRGTPLVILEAMKMEHQITAPYDGRVTAVNCREGELVQPGVDLITIEPAT